MPEFESVDRSAVINAAWALHLKGERPTLTALQLQFDGVPEARLQGWLDEWAEQQRTLGELPPLPAALAVLGQRLYVELGPALVAQGRQQAAAEIDRLKSELKARPVKADAGGEVRAPSAADEPAMAESVSAAAPEAGDDASPWEAQIKALQARSAREQAAAELSRTNLELAESRIADLERQVQEAQQRYTSALSASNQRLDGLTLDHKKALMDLRAELEREHQSRLQQEVERRQNEARKAAADVQAAQRRLSDLGMEAEAQRLDNARLTADLGSAKRELAKLQERLAETQADLDNTRSLLKEARRGR